MNLIKKIIEHKFFERFIISIILINWITMWLETSKNIMQNYWDLIYFFDKIVIAIFTIEALLKILTYKFSYFKNWWNLFDFSIVVISLIPASWPFQILRILRVFRLLRLITIVPSMRKIVSALLWVIPGILSVWWLLLIIYYVFAIMVTQLYWETFPQWFGDLWNSFYTLFQIMTLESWSMWIVRPVIEIHPYAWIVFVTFVLIATFVMINLVVAIVVDAMNKINSKEEKDIIESIETSKNATKEDLKKLENRIEELIKIMKK